MSVKRSEGTTPGLGSEASGGGSPLTTKGDIAGFSTVDERIPVGADETVLVADSGEGLGVKWAAPPAPISSFLLMGG